MKETSQSTCLSFSLTGLSQDAITLQSPAEHMGFRLHYGSLKKNKAVASANFILTVILLFFLAERLSIIYYTSFHI